ncbi:MAG: RCC1-like domain-containing protein [Solirubrobacteraceae bacterium]
MRRRHASAVTVLLVLLAVAACAGAASGPADPVYRFGVPGNRGKIVQLERDRPTIVAGITGKVVQVATSNSDGYALTSGGTVWAWGVGSYGELGYGKTPPYSTTAVRVEFPAGVRVVALPNPMPFDGALAIDSHRHVWGWGLNGDGDLCLSSLLLLRPRQISLSDVTLATGARTHSLFDSHGKLYACGSGDAGELGNGSTAPSSKPTAVKGLPRGASISALTSSWEGSGALLSDGAYYDWGYNAAGQLGNRSTADGTVPVRVKLSAAVGQVFQGGSGPTNGQTIAILKDGSVWTWGDNDRGQLGDGTTASSDVPVRVKVPAGVRFLKVNSGGYACYAIDSSGRLWAWGGNQNGQLGIGSGARIESRPVDVGIHFTQVSSTASNVAGFQRSP